MTGRACYEADAFPYVGLSGGTVSCAIWMRLQSGLLLKRDPVIHMQLASMCHNLRLWGFFERQQDKRSTQ